MKTVAVIACSDTKLPEIEYVCERFRLMGVNPLVLDPSTSAGYVSPFEITREDITAAAGLDWKSMEGGPKHELLEAVANGAAVLAASLYAAGRIHGAFCMGGLQNTVVGGRAMRALPIGVPKLIVSTVASGQRPFDLVVGSRDIVVMPSVCDLAGMNVISETVLGNAVAAMCGMLMHAGSELPAGRSGRPTVGATLMGATNDGVDRAANIVRASGVEVIAFHSTGVGGQVLEELIESGLITASMDLTLHELVYEYFGKGFGYGANGRLEAGAAKGIPMVVAPGGIDFICQWKHELFTDIDRRKMIWHNADLAHVKLNKQEVYDIAGMMVERLNRSSGKVEVIVPTLGLRSFARPGEALHDAELDKIIYMRLDDSLRRDIPVKYIEANIMDEKFSEFAAFEMLRLMHN